MKKFFLMATMLLAFGIANAQISDVQQKGGRIYTYGDNNKELSWMSIGSSDEYLGMGSSFFVVQKGGRVYTYDANCREIAWMSIGSSDKFKSAGGNSFNIKKGGRIYTYDKNCKELSWRNE